MNIKKTLLAASAAATLGVAGIGGLGIASAATNNDMTNRQANLVSKIAQKFNLNQADVQAVFDQDRASHEADMQARIEQKLTQAVKEGKITQVQKDAIVAKMAEMKSTMESEMSSMRGKTPAERRQVMKQHEQDLKTWAKDNNIPIKYLMFMGGHHGRGGPMMHQRQDDSNSN